MATKVVIIIINQHIKAMKKHYFRQMALGLAMILAAWPASAQTHYTSTIVMQTALSTPEGYPRPIRNWNSRYSVGVVGDTSAIGLSLIDHSAFIAPSTGFAPVITERHAKAWPTFNDPNTTITDIYVANDYAFFCGYVHGTSLGNRAVVGYIYLPDMVTGSAQLNGGYINGIERLKRLVAYKTEDGYRVYAIGENIIHPAGGATYTAEAIVEIDNIFSSPIQYQIAWLYANSFFKKEYLYDVLLTNDYVVFVGHNYSPACYDMLHFRMIRKVLSFPSPDIDNVYFFPAPSEANSRVASTALNENTFAVSYVYVDPSTTNHFTRLRLIDLNTMANVNAQQMARPDKMDPVMIDYLPEKDLVEMLQPYNNPYDFLSWEPYRTVPYISHILTPHKGTDYQYMRSLAGKMFIASSGPYLYLQDPSLLLPASNPVCPSYFKAYVAPIPEMPIVIQNIPLSATTDPALILHYDTIFSSILQKVCYSEQ